VKANEKTKTRITPISPDAFGCNEQLALAPPECGAILVSVGVDGMRVGVRLGGGTWVGVAVGVCVALAVDVALGGLIGVSVASGRTHSSIPAALSAAKNTDVPAAVIGGPMGATSWI